MERDLNFNGKRLRDLVGDLKAAKVHLVTCMRLENDLSLRLVFAAYKLTMLIFNCAIYRV